MSFDLSGYVLRPARSASGNSTSTGESTTGVCRDHISPSALSAAGYELAVGRDVEPYADMYRAAVLLRTSESTDEYMIWAATTGSYSTVESEAFTINGNPDFVTSAKGSLTVGAFSDGTDTLYVQDSGGRDLSSLLDPVTNLQLMRGDDQSLVTAAFSSQDPSTGEVVLDSATQTLLGGGFSKKRGDLVLIVQYVLAGPRFWWSRNDSEALRFGWDGGAGRWTPFKGSPPQDLGAALEDPDETYELSPPPTRFEAGEELPGTPGTPDEFSIIRAGPYPDSTATPLSVLVVSDTLAEAPYPTGAPYSSYNAVVGETTGVLVLEPTWAADNAGLTLWYNPESFRPDNDGFLANLAGLATDSSLGSPVLSPIPGPTEFPFVRIGYRRHLTPIPKANDASLDDPAAISSGTFQWSQTTGKIVLSADDIKKAQPLEAEYSIAYLSAKIYYDGVSLSTQPVPVQSPAALLDEDGNPLIGEGAGGTGVPVFGKLFIRRASSLPPPGTAGVLYVPDGTGKRPDISAGPPNARPNGSGLVRKINGVGDTFIFASSRALPDLTVEEYQEDIPILKIRVKKTEAVTSRMPAAETPGGATNTSQVQMKRRGLKGDGAFFAQAQCTPSVYASEARIYSRLGEPFVLDGAEELRFRVDSDTYTWTASAAGSFTAAQIAAELNTLMSGSGAAGVFRGRVWIEADDPENGSVEIGWNADEDDLSGHAALGFLPSWRVEVPGAEFRWLPDNGASVGLYRSPENLDRSSRIADVKAVGVYNDVLMTNNIPQTPFFTVTNPPLEDIPGYDEGVHFRLALGLNLIRLSNYGVRQGVGVKYDWDNDRFIWTRRGEFAATAVVTPSEILQFEDTNVLQETVSSDAMAPVGDGFGLYLKEAGQTSYTEQSLGSDFLMIAEGAAGQATLIDREGQPLNSGGRGEFAAGASPFSNPILSTNATQNTALQLILYSSTEVGDRLHLLNGPSKGLYTITDKNLVGGIAEFDVSPGFPEADEGVSWKVLEGQLLTELDPTILADVQQVAFNHFPEEPFKLRLLSSIGTVGGSLTASVADAVASERVVLVRFGLTAPGIFATPAYLERGVDLGVLSEEGLGVPDLSNPHFTASGATSYFQIRVGAEKYSTTLGNLTLVDNFSAPIPTGEIEVGKDGSAGGVDGEIRFATDVISGFAGEHVYWDELLLAGSLLASGTCEVNGATGEVQLSSADETTYAGLTAYFVEQMVTEGQLDVVLSPMQGSVYFAKPLRSGQIVEAEYWQADTDGDKLNDTLITEFLPLTVRLEEATRVDGFTYTYNPTGKTLSEKVDPAIWVGVELQNFAGITEATIEGSTLKFESAVDPADSVKLNYGVLEAFGGEQGYTVSSIPVYRKPFFLLADEATATLDGDRTADILVGQMGVLGPSVFYVKAVLYSPSEDQTTITVFPTPQEEIGSRAPGLDSAFLLTSVPVAITVDPADPVSGGGNAGFLVPVAESLLPADRGQLDFVFVGDVTQYTKAGHLLEVAGHPYLIVAGILSGDGRFTSVSVSNPLYQGYDDSDTVRVSSRPIYEQNPTTFQGISPYLEGEDFDLFLVGSVVGGVEIPGKLLASELYATDPSTGGVELIPPSQGPLKPGERLVASYTATRAVGPIVDDAAILTPSFLAKYLYASFPSRKNRIKGASLTAKYTFASPDTFYFETLPLRDFLSEVSGIVLSNASSTTTGGAASAFPGLPDNSGQGSLGLRGEVADLDDQDRAARSFISLYNGVVLAFEQILESIDGRIIGDRDGKFRFFVGRGKRYAPPGYEDEITGALSTRLIWRMIVDEWADDALLADGYYKESDPAYDPTTAYEKDPTDRPGETDGDTPDPDTLDTFTFRQRRRIKNDMDDRLLIGFARPRGLALLFPGLAVPGEFKSMWQAHIFSRLFPERTKHFSRLLPGLKARLGSTGYTDPGFYSSGRKIEKPGPEPGETTTEIIKTRKTAIGKIANPALGEITGIIDVTAGDRLPRARVWRYYPEGSAKLDSALTALLTGISVTVSTVGQATLVATPLPLGEFPIDEDSGFPDATQFLFGPTPPAGASLFSLFTGDADLSTPGFEEGQRLRFGTPRGAKGSTYDLTDPKGNGVFVGEIQAGCVLTLVDVKGDPLSGGQVLVNDNTPLEDVVSDGTGRGDTIFVAEPVVDQDDVPKNGDSPTVKQMTDLAQSLPDYRIQFDLKIGKGTGDFIDASLPTREDAFFLPLQNMFGQKPPGPLTCIEGAVEFTNSDRKPVKLPCLKGEAKDDSGDIQIPYMVGSETELSILGEVAAQFKALLGSDSSVAIPYGTQIWKAVYPDEVVMADGSLNEAYTTSPDRDPATLYSTRDVTPVATSGSYTNDSAVGDGRPYDILLIETGQPLEVSGELLTGMTGVLSIGAISGFAANTDHSKIEPPRFVTRTAQGDTHKYWVGGAYGYLGGAFPAVAGVFPTETSGATFTALLTCSSVGGLVFDSDEASLAGGLLALVAGGNAILIEVFDSDPGAGAGQSLLGTIVIPTLAAAGAIYVNDPFGAVTTITLAGSGVSLTTPYEISIEATATILGALSAITASTYYDFKVSIDTYITATTAALTGGAISAGSAGGSSTCYVDEDRLTFVERVSFATALPRGTTPANGDALEMGVQIELLECPVGAVSGSTVNAPTEVNGGDPFELLERVGPDPDATVSAGVPYVGVFIPATAGSEEGKLRMLAWEGHNNTPLPFSTTPVSGVKASVVPSSDLAEAVIIYEGTGTFHDDSDPADTIEGTRHWLDTLPAATAGALANVTAGDILVADRGSSAGKGAVSAGTYLVRHAVETNDGTGYLWQTELFSDAGMQDGLDLGFPEVGSASSLTLIAKNVPPVQNSAEGCGFATGDGTTTYVYLILSQEYTSYDSGTSEYTLNADSVYRMLYSAVVYDAGAGEATFTLVTGSAEDALGAALPNGDSDFTDAAGGLGVLVSGMGAFQMKTSPTFGLPENNVVGSEDDESGNDATAGFTLAVVGNRNTTIHPAGGVTTQTWDKTATIGDFVYLKDDTSTAGAGVLGIRVPEGADNTEFYTDRGTVVYGRKYNGAPPRNKISGVPVHVSLGEATSAQWNAIHFDTTKNNSATSAPIADTDHRLYCLLPKDRVMFGDTLEGGGTPGFTAISGVFLEPSFPRPTTDLNFASPHVVSAGHSLLGSPEAVGHRNFSDFVSGTYEEAVHFLVRRIRRFHEVQTEISNNLALLKYVYETRRGDFVDGVDGSYNTSTRVFTAGSATYGTATNVGEFDEGKVNIHAGDVLRILDSSGDLVDEAEIMKVKGSGTLKLRRPGLTASLSSAVRFEVYLEQAVVPAEQSNAQLLDLVTDQVLVNRVVDYSAGDTDGGGASDFNTMQDSLIADWASEGVQEGDYVLVPPSGTLYDLAEVGTRPVGDTSVDGRTPYVAGDVASLDDNRGFYKVTGVVSGDLEVDGTSRFGGGLEDGSDDVVLGDSASDSEYAVLPTVHASSLTGGREGQQPLRPTADAVGGLFSDRTTGSIGDPGYKSIAPFAYRIIRPSSIFSEDALELVLFSWERMLSWIEEMKSVYETGRGGDYWVFQRDGHIDDVGSPTDPTDGAGVVSNLVIEGLSGLTGETPYANVSDCLSILGRRFWVLDSRLDELGYTQFADDSWGQRPVFPDLIEDVLNLDDRFRDMRFSWISYRADRVSGSIVKARRARNRLPEELEKQQELLDQKRSLE